MKYIPLSTTDQKFHNATHKFIILAADVAALGAATTGVIQLFPNTADYSGATAPVGTEINFTKAQVVTAFTGGSISAMTVQVGLTGGDTDAYLAALDILTAATYDSEGAVTIPAQLTTADTIDALFTSTTDNLSSCTAGELHLYFKFTTPTLDMKNIAGALS